MGTRNLTVVIQKEKPKIAQYGQWDGYPSGQGATVLEFLKSADLEQFKKKLKVTKWINKAKQKEIDEWLKSIGCEDGWMNSEQSKLYQEKYPLLTRDNCAKILELIYNSEEPVNWIHNSIDFATDKGGFSCEWAYVIDLDKMKLEVYNGYSDSPLEPGDRFYKKPKAKKNKDGILEEGKCWGIKLVKEYDIKNLPTEEDFISECEPKEKEE